MLETDKIKKAADTLISKINIIKEKLTEVSRPETIIKIEMPSKEIFCGEIIRPDTDIISFDKPAGLYKELKNIYKKNKEDKHYVIYVISVKNILKVININETRKKFNYLKRKSYCLSRIIDSHWKKSSCLYVGSSQDIITRLKQHLGINTKGKIKSTTTYALYLNAWLPKYIRENTITIDIYRFNAKTFGIKTEIKIQNYLQITEDLLWEVNKPLFGKQGAK